MGILFITINAIEKRKKSTQHTKNIPFVRLENLRFPFDLPADYIYFGFRLNSVERYTSKWNENKVHSCILYGFKVLLCGTQRWFVFLYFAFFYFQHLTFIWCNNLWLVYICLFRGLHILFFTEFGNGRRQKKKLWELRLNDKESGGNTKFLKKMEL